MLGVRLSLDIGEARIGVARTDPDGIMALPLENVPADERQYLRVAEIAQECHAVMIYVGLPLHLNGSEGRTAEKIRHWVAVFSALLPDIPVRFIDERLTTVSAHQLLGSVGLDSRARKSLVDMQAAVLILEQALEIEKREVTRERNSSDDS
ncbi:MAG: Holliday junction resolvase RuvX [Varibaculum sp.]|nr:Holliday junction resolvase RuvX [Varibaculum sp.]